ncbi:MRP-L47-domain-containing protein [Byssothecium circinans]|uniref:Large ribosomal subunit protein uL29m n=1 Tax=Byssothecium circinans TaxID=147558 RepID=A0A6A5U6T4_9PLEO|nr:MRP-L47-domain-containing protein [Byssothecium circinans]
MSAIPTFRIARPTRLSTPIDAARSLLTPSANCARIAPVARFSSSPSSWGRGDNNKNRGNSAVRGTGLRKRQTLSVTNPRSNPNASIPKPVARTSTIQGDPDHGLWEFFKDRKLLATPVEESKHGRAWTVNELRSRDWETLQQLWWVCVKERNRLATEKLERKRLNAGFGDAENEARDKVVQETMKAIIDTLVERNTAYHEAYQLAQSDPTIDLTRSEHQYQEPTYEANELIDENLDDPDGAVPTEVRENQAAAPDAVFEEPQRSKDHAKQTTI